MPQNLHWDLSEAHILSRTDTYVHCFMNQTNTCKNLISFGLLDHLQKHQRTMSVQSTVMDFKEQTMFAILSLAV